MNSNLFKAILAMDSYNRGYGATVEMTGNQVGLVTILTTKVNEITVNPASL
jgi:hypothetical protein